MKQEKVACLIDNDARLAAEPKDPFAIQVGTHTLHTLDHAWA